MVSTPCYTNPEGLQPRFPAHFLYDKTGQYIFETISCTSYLYFPLHLCIMEGGLLLTQFTSTKLCLAQMCLNTLLLKQTGCNVTFYSVFAPIKYTCTLQKFPQKFRFSYKCSTDWEFETTAPHHYASSDNSHADHTLVLLDRAMLG